VAGDRADPDALGEVAQGAEAVIDLCCFDDGQAAALCDALDSACRRVVYASSLAEYGHAGLTEVPLREDGPFVPDDPYGLGKHAARRLLDARLGARMATLLLPHVVDPEDPAPREAVHMLEARLTGGRTFVPADLRRLAWISTRDVAALIARLIEAPPGRTPVILNACHPAPLDLRAFVAALCDGAQIVPVDQRRCPGVRFAFAGRDTLAETSRAQAMMCGHAWDDAMALARQMGMWLAGVGLDELARIAQARGLARDGAVLAVLVGAGQR